MDGTTTRAALVLLTDAGQHAALKRYVAQYVEGTNWLVRQILDSHVTDQVRLHRRYYGELRERFHLPAQSAVLCLKHAAKLYRQASPSPRLGPEGPVPYDRHLYRLRSIDRLSLTTLEGRLIVPCVVSSYDPGGFPVGEADLTLRNGLWVFGLRTSLSTDSRESPQQKRDITMSDKLLSRITRLVSGIAHNAVGQAEEAAPVAVMEQMLREIDDAMKEVRAEIGRHEATKFNVARRIKALGAA